MNLIKEPLDVDFVAIDKPWTTTEKAQLSFIIQSAKKQAGPKGKGLVKRNFGNKR